MPAWPGVAVLIGAVGRDSDVSVLRRVHRDVCALHQRCRCPRRGPGTRRRRRCPRRRAPCRRCRPARAGPRGSGSPSRARPLHREDRRARCRTRPPETGDRVALADCLLQARTEPLQQEVTGVVAERVVDLLEPIEIEQDQPSPPIGRFRGRDRSVLAWSWNSDRFGRPVRESCVDWCSFSADTSAAR